MNNKNDILLNLKKLSSEIKFRYKSLVKGIFGSYVRNEERDDSDIDLLVEFDEEADLFDMAGLSLFLEEELKCKVDLIPESSIRDEIKDVILRETIYI